VSIVPSYQVRGLTPQGQLQERQLNASSPEEAKHLALHSGLEVLEIKAVGLGTLFAARTPRFDLVLFTHELMALLSAGLSLIEALDTLAERQQQNHRGNSVLTDLTTRMREGLSFSRALAAHPDLFPELYVASVSASEQTGEMVDALQRYLRYHEQVSFIRQKIVSASLYPAMLLLLGTGVGIFLLCFLVPRFSHVYEGLDASLPWASRVLMHWGMLVSEHAGLVTVALAMGVVGLVATVRRPEVQHYLMERLQRNRWLGSPLRLMQLSRFYRSLGLLLRGGIPALKALRMARLLLPGGMQLALGRAIEEVSQGKALSDSLERHGLTTSVALRLLRAGERNGQVADMLERIAAFHDKEVGHWIDRFARLFEPLLMLFIGVVIGGIVILLYLPIFELAGNL
jgi:general secretion pathway protein F